MKERLTRNQLLQLIDRLMHPSRYGSSERESDEALLTFCAECPDPVKARWLIVECLDPMTNEEIVDRALAMPSRKMVDVPLSELPEGHPLRAMAQ